jgi:rhodanese-related sulfurtransferase
MKNTIIIASILGSVGVGILLGLFFKLCFTQNITPEKLTLLIRHSSRLVIIDVRNQNKYISGHIEGAVDIDLNKNFKKIISKYLKCSIYVVYSEQGIKSIKACRWMKELEFQNVYNLKGGYLNYINYLDAKNILLNN